MAAVVARFNPIPLRVDFAGIIQLSMPGIIQIITQAHAPTGKMLDKSIIMRFYCTCIDKGCSLQPLDARLTTHLGRSSKANIAAALTGTVGTHAVHAAQVEHFAAVQVAVGNLAAELYAVVCFAVINNVQQVTCQLMIVAVQGFAIAT